MKTQCQPEPIIFRHPKEWITWWNTEKDYDTEHFDEIQVPSVWQMAGYDVHQYTNIRYPFPFDPPYVPQGIPCGVYVHTFDYSRDEKAPRAFLNFEGVDKMELALIVVARLYWISTDLMMYCSGSSLLWYRM